MIVNGFCKEVLSASCPWSSQSRPRQLLAISLDGSGRLNARPGETPDHHGTNGETMLEISNLHATTAEGTPILEVASTCT